MNDSRYEASFYRFGDEDQPLEFSSDDLGKAKNWLVDLLCLYPSPAYAALSDQQLDKVLFEEKN